MSTDLAVQEQVALTPLSLIQSALSSGTPVDVIRELVALQQSMVEFEWKREERQAEQDFGDALNDCQSQIGRIAPNQKRNDTNSWWADYAQLDRTIRPIYTAAGFSIAFSEVEPLSPGKVRIKAALRRGRIEREYFAQITPTTTGPKGGAMATATDADAIAQSRAKRYLMLDIFNIAIGIDADEKKPFAEATPALSDVRFGDLMAEIEGAVNPEERRKAFAKAWNEAGAIRDFKSRTQFKEVYDKLKENN